MNHRFPALKELNICSLKKLKFLVRWEISHFVRDDKFIGVKQVEGKAILRSKIAFPSTYEPIATRHPE